MPGVGRITTPARLTTGPFFWRIMVSYILFCVFVGLGGACIGLFFNLRTLGLSICIIANCLLFIGASIGGMIAFAKGLKATQTYHVCDGEHKVMLNLKFGAFSYTVNVPVTEYNCPNCMENALCPTPTPSQKSD